MRERPFGDFLFWCDGRCRTVLDTATDKARAANAMLLNAGWRVKDGQHYCPECLTKLAIKRAADRAEKRRPAPWEKWR